MRPAALAAALLMTGCAARTPFDLTQPLPSPPALDDSADRLIRAGCYRCLEQAYELADARVARRSAFEAATLLALRSKELGLTAEAWLGRARALASGSPTWSAQVEMADAVPPDRLSQERDALFDVGRRRRVRDNLETWRETLGTGEGSEPFRAYLDVSLVCGFGVLKEDAASFTGPVDQVMATPLLQFAIGNCDLSQRSRLMRLRESAPDFVDADYALGRYALEDAASPDAEEALRRFQSAAEAFPTSPAIAVRLGNLHRGWEEWAPALAVFDRALAVAPGHPEATIGRAVSLSHLERSPEAIEATTDLIDGGQWLLGEAYYWRAWNHLRLGQLALAQADIGRARSLMANAAVLVLSGAIEWRLRNREAADKDFQAALAIDLGECEAALDLGVVRDELGRPAEALAALKQSGQCYDLSIALRRDVIAKIHAGPGSPALKTRDAARHERVLAEFLERRGEVARLVEGLAPPTQPR